MTKDTQARPSHLFTIRVWLETLDDDRSEWRGKVQHVLTGERHYFRDWETLVEYLLFMLPEKGDLSISQKPQ